MNKLLSRYKKVLVLTSLFVILALPVASMAQNLGTTTSTGQAVQGQKATQVEGSIMNAVNWLSNVICPTIAAVCFVAAGFKYQAQKPYMSSIVGGGIFLAVSAATRLIEYFIAQGQQIGSLHLSVPSVFASIQSHIHILSRLG